jgi:hypothetical protein
MNINQHLIKIDYFCLLIFKITHLQLVKANNSNQSKPNKKIGETRFTIFKYVYE